jgi:hypothetical protein
MASDDNGLNDYIEEEDIKQTDDDTTMNKENDPIEPVVDTNTGNNVI